MFASQNATRSRSAGFVTPLQVFPSPFKMTEIAGQSLAQYLTIAKRYRADE